MVLSSFGGVGSSIGYGATPASGASSAGDYSVATLFLADLNVGVNIEREWAWSLGSTAHARYLAAMGVKHVRMTYPYRPSYDFGQGQPGTEGRQSDRPTKTQFDRILAAAKLYTAEGVKVFLECGDDIGTADTTTLNLAHLNGHITNCASWIAAQNFSTSLLAVGAFGEYQGSGNAYWNAKRATWHATLRATLPGFIIVEGGGNSKSKDNFIKGTAESDLFEVATDPLTIYDFHYFSSLDATGYGFVADQIKAWSTSKGGRPVMAGAWGVDPSQAANPAAIIPQMQASLAKMAFQHPTLWVVTGVNAGWKLNNDGQTLNFNDGTNARPNYYGELRTQVAAVKAALTGTTTPPPVVEEPPPVVALTPRQVAQNFVAKLTVGVNIERARIWYMQYQGSSFADSDLYWDYLKNTPKVTHIRGFYPWRPFYDMNGDGKYGSVVPSDADVDRIMKVYRRAQDRGLKVFHACMDVMELEEMEGYWPQITELLRRTCRRALAAGLTADMFCLNPFNEMAGATNADFNQYRLDAHAIIRAELPNHIIVHAGAYWGHPSALVNNSDDAWAAPPDKLTIAEWHNYGGDDFDGQLDDYVTSFAAFQTRNDNIPIVAGEAGSDDLFVAGHQQYSDRWTYNLGRQIAKFPFHRPMLWAVTDGGEFRHNRSTTDPRLLATIEATMSTGDAVVRAKTGFGVVAVGSSGGSTTPPATVYSFDWKDGNDALGTVYAPSVGANAPVTKYVTVSGYRRLAWVVVDGTTYSWKSDVTGFNVVDGDNLVPGLYVKADHDFVKILLESDYNVRIDSLPATVVVSAGGGGEEGDPSDPHLQLESITSNAIIRSASSSGAEIRLVRPLYYGEQMFNVTAVNAGGATIDNIYWTYRPDFLDIQGGRPALKRSLTSLDDGNFTTDIVCELSDGQVLVLPLTVSISPSAEGAAPSPTPIPDPKTVIFFEDFDFGKGFGAFYKTYRPQDMIKHEDGSITVAGDSLMMTPVSLTGAKGPGGFGNGLFEAYFQMYGDNVGSGAGQAFTLWPFSDNWPGPEVNGGELNSAGDTYVAVHRKNPTTGLNESITYVIPDFDRTVPHKHSIYLQNDKITFLIDNAVLATHTTWPAPDFANGGEDHTMGFSNNSPETSLRVWWAKHTPEQIIEANGGLATIIAGGGSGGGESGGGESGGGGTPVSESLDPLGPGGGTAGALNQLLGGQSNALLFYYSDNTYESVSWMNTLIYQAVGQDWVGTEAERSDYSPESSSLWSGSYPYAFTADDGPRWMDSSPNPANVAEWTANQPLNAFKNYAASQKNKIALNRPFPLILMFNEYLSRLGSSGEIAVVEAALRRLITEYRSSMGRSISLTPVFLVNVPYNSGTNINMVRAIRQAHKNMIADTAFNCYMAVGNTLDAEHRGDNSHWTRDSASRIALRIGVRIARWYHDNGWSGLDLSWLPTLGPRIARAEKVAGNTSAVDIVITHNKGTDLIMPASPNFGCYDVTANGTPRTVTAQTKIAVDRVRLTLDGPLASSNNKFDFGLGTYYMGPDSQIMDNWHLLSRPSAAAAIEDIGLVRMLLNRNREVMDIV